MTPAYQYRSPGRVQAQPPGSPGPGKTYPGIKAQGTGDVICKKPADAATIDAANELTAEPAERQRVILQFRSRFADRHLVGQQLRHANVIRRLLRRHRRRKSRQSGLMRNKMPNEDPILTMSCELRPIGADRQIEVQLTAFEQQKQARRHKSFGPRKIPAIVSASQARRSPRSAEPAQMSITGLPSTTAAKAAP